MTFATGKCLTCRHGGADPDGFYCAHPEAMKQSPFGLSPNAMLNERDGRGNIIEPLCKGFKLYEQCTCDHVYCPRHGVRPPRTIERV